MSKSVFILGLWLEDGGSLHEVSVRLEPRAELLGEPCCVLPAPGSFMSALPTERVESPFQAEASLFDQGVRVGTPDLERKHPPS